MLVGMCRHYGMRTNTAVACLQTEKLPERKPMICEKHQMTEVSRKQVKDNLVKRMHKNCF